MSDLPVTTSTHLHKDIADSNPDGSTNIKDSEPFVELKNSVPRKITGDEPYSIVNFLLAVINLITKYDLDNNSVHLVMISRVKKGTVLHKMITESTEDNGTWPNLILALYNRFPGHLYNQGRGSYLTTLKELHEYQGMEILESTSILTILAMFLKTHDLARACTKAAKHARPAKEAFRQFRDKVFMNAPIMAPILAETIFHMERKATSLGKEKFDVLFLEIANNYCNGLNPFKNDSDRKATPDIRH